MSLRGTVDIQLKTDRRINVFKAGEVLHLDIHIQGFEWSDPLSWVFKGFNQRGRVSLQEDLTTALSGKAKASKPVAITLDGKGLVDICVQASRGSSTLESNRVRISIVDESAVPKASEHSPFGMGIYLCRYKPEEFDEVLSLCRSIGVSWSRIDFGWGGIESAKSTYRWKFFDSIVDAHERYSVNMLGLVGYTTAWSGKDFDKHGYSAPPKDLNDWYSFVHTIVSRYKGRIKYWEIWNEADWHRKDDLAVYFAGTVDEYYEVLKTAYRAVKQADPGAQVLLSGLGLGTKDRTWLDKLMQLGASEYFEITNVHSYFGWDRVLKAQDTINHYSESEKPLWITEIGLETMTWIPGKSERDQAMRVVVEYVKSLSEGVEKIFWYDFRDDGEDPENPFFNLGIIKRNGIPKVAFQAYYAMTSILGEVEFRRALSAESISDCYLFEGEENWVVVAWNAESSQPLGLENSLADIQVFDILGEEIRQYDGETFYAEPIWLKIPKPKQHEGLLDQMTKVKMVLDHVFSESFVERSLYR